MQSLNSHRGSSFPSVRVIGSTWRIALIVPIVFGLAVLLGYNATAKAPAIFKTMVQMHRPLAQPNSVKRVNFVQAPVHPVERLLNLAMTVEPIVFTDKPNYFPGETALISGAGFWPNEIITLQVVHTDGTANDGGGHEPWNVIADNFGNFDTTWFVDPDDSAGSAFLLIARGNSSGLVAEVTFTDGSANLDTCANGPANAPVFCTGDAWENGNLNSSKSHYLEGQSVPYRTILENLIPGNTYTLAIEYDTTQGGDHAFDYLTSFDRTEPKPGNNPCTRKQGNAIVSICDPLTFVTTPIPTDPNVTAGQDGTPGTIDDISQIAGLFTLYNGNTFSIVNPGNPYTLDGTYAGNSSTSITVQFNATAAIAVIAWGGHISTRLDWGAANSAIAITGSPYHMRLTGMTCSGQGEICNVGQQDHQLSADAVFFPIQLTIVKETNPDDAQVKQFNYTTTGNNLGPFSLTPTNGMTAASTMFNLTDTTARTVTESDPSAAAPQFNLTALSCVQVDGGLGVGTFSTNLMTRTVNFTPKEGQFITCTFVNTEDFTQTRGRILVDKVTNPSGDPTSFNFTSTYGSGFSLTDASAPNDSGQVLMPGTYSVSETANADYVTTATCTSSLGHAAEDPSSINLAAGETVTCTFTNTKRGHIIVDKVTNPSGDPQSFNFDASGTGYVDFSLTDAAAANDQTLAPGNYSVSETVPSGWDLTSSTCVSSIMDTEAPGAIELDAGETVTCTFTNTKRGHIIVDKVTNPSGDPQSFSFDANGGSYADFSLTDAAMPNDQTLVPGNYSVSETVPSGWDLTSSTCVSSIMDTEAPGAIELDAGETVTCTFTNTKRGHIIVDKVTNPSGDPQSFSFDANGGSYADFNLTDAAMPNDQTLVPGNYSVSETVPSGWDLTSSTCVSSIMDTEAPGAIELDPGETVTCTFTNTKRGHIIVDKVTNPSGDPQSFSFDANGGSYADFSLTDAAMPNDQTLVPGNYSVSETVPSGWDLTSSTCVSSIMDTEAPGAIELDPGETVTCTFTNTKRGHIIVDKVTNPSGDPQSFNFDAGGTGYVDFSLTDAAMPNDQTLVPGNYSVSETVPSGWDLTSSTCVSSIMDTEAPGAIELDPGETVTCTFTNTKRGHIIVDKVTNPSGDPQSFNFDANGGSYADFSLTDAAMPNDQTLVPGNYSVSETVPAGWDLTSSTCVSSIMDTEAPGTIELDAGETVTCTFTNTKRGHILVDKVTNPSGDPQSFSFDANGGSYADFSLTDAAMPNDQTLVPGNYSVSETVPAGWDLTSSTCVSSIMDTEAPGAIELDAGETVTCTFTNTKRGHIIVDKVTNPSGDPQSFSFDANGGSYADFSLTDAAMPNDQTLVPGSYSVSETVPSGWDLTSATCVSSIMDTEAPGTIELDAGETVTCTFTNRKRANLIVEKQTNPDGASGSFTFTGTAAGTISDGGMIAVSNLVPGNYTSTENSPAPNFDLTSIVCDDMNSTGDVPSRTATFRLEPGETVKCVFTNTQRGMGQVIKTVNGAPPSGTHAFTFQIRQGASMTEIGTTLESGVANAGNGGILNFNTKLVPGQTYQMCEVIMPGWLSTLGTFVPNSFMPPDGVAVNPNVDNSIVCVDFTVTPGETKTFTVDNTPPPGGRALTIGFWKNWSGACTGGSQADTLGTTLMSFPIAAGQTTRGVFIGKLYVDNTCLEAVPLLDKREIGTRGKKMASDPAFNLAAQLLAAKLNVQAGAGICPPVVTAITQAQNLLYAVGFNGTGSYLKKMNPAQAALANCLATWLDDYNNNRLTACDVTRTCP
ncbi:MAG TPA: hypothetical protein VFR78_03435 [Pyrinomonadaceae bacterium]|nr:hypothetical protein [Pyrinomonadaceae bacterium]